MIVRSRERALDLAEEVRDQLDLLLDRRLGLFLVLDSIFLVRGLFAALLGGRETAAGIWVFMVVLPLVLLGVPTLSSVVALERRSGTLDLVLASASPGRFLVRRIAVVCGLLATQSVVFLALLAREPGLPVALIHALVAHVFLGAVVLFWAVRLRSAGATFAASLVTVVVFGRWLFGSAFPMFGGALQLAYPKPWLQAALEALVPPLVLALAALLFGLYARARLRRLESLLD